MFQDDVCIACNNAAPSVFVLYCGRIPAANTPGRTAAEGLLYEGRTESHEQQFFL